MGLLVSIIAKAVHHIGVRFSFADESTPAQESDDLSQAQCNRSAKKRRKRKKNKGYTENECAPSLAPQDNDIHTESVICETQATRVVKRVTFSEPVPEKDKEYYRKKASYLRECNKRLSAKLEHIYQKERSENPGHDELEKENLLRSQELETLWKFTSTVSTMVKHFDSKGNIIDLDVLTVKKLYKAL